MERRALFPRFSDARLLESLQDSPVTLIHGPRQCGKTTLARTVGSANGYRYLSFDDPVARQSATEDPMGFATGLPDRVVLDEAQRVPELFSVLKLIVDRERRAGRFVLTGSTNVLLIPTLSDSLAGRMQILRLHPLSQCECDPAVSRGFVDALLGNRFRVGQSDRLGDELAERIAAGGYPAALLRRASSRKSAWYRDFAETIVQRDAADISRIRSLDILPRLLAVSARETASLLNVSRLASSFQLSATTVGEYLALLERLFLVERVPPYRQSRTARAVKTPKLHLGDSGLACALLRLDAEGLRADRSRLGHLLETFVFQELRRQASWRQEPLAFFHFRDRDGAEVDIVIEKSVREIVGVEVKASATVTGKDFRGLRALRESAGNDFVCGVVLYDGELSLPFGDRLHAVPIRALWKTPVP